MGQPREAQSGPGQGVVDDILDAVPQGVIAVDSQGRIARVNDSACEIFGYTRPELVGEALDLLIPEGLRERHRTHMGEFLRSPRRRMMGYGTGELLGRRKDGTAVPVDVGLGALEVDGQQLALAFVSDVTERRNSQEELRQGREKLEHLARQQTMVAEEESRKWARELHDVYSQRLVGVAMELARVAGDGGDPERVRGVEQQVRTLAEDIHHLSRSMHPSILHDLGLSPALRSELAAFERDQGVKTEFVAREVPGRLPPDVALCFYRVAQESLRNIRKHSGADRVTVSLEGDDDGLTMTVEDLGDGFELNQVLRRGGLGLISMEERVLGVGGEFSVKSEVGRGTTVRVRVPLN